MYFSSLHLNCRNFCYWKPGQNHLSNSVFIKLAHRVTYIYNNFGSKCTFWTLLLESWFPNQEFFLSHTKDEGLARKIQRGIFSFLCKFFASIFFFSFFCPSRYKTVVLTRKQYNAYKWQVILARNSWYFMKSVTLA